MRIHTNFRVLLRSASSKSNTSYSSSPVTDHHPKYSMLIDDGVSRHMHPFSLSTYFLRYPPPALKRYSSGGRGHESEKEDVGEEEEEEIVRAPSLAEEFKRLEEEKANEGGTIAEAAEQGLASQTDDKTAEALEEAATAGGNGKDDPDHLQETVKTRYKEHEPGADYRRRGHLNTTTRD